MTALAIALGVVGLALATAWAYVEHTRQNGADARAAKVAALEAMAAANRCAVSAHGAQEASRLVQEAVSANVTASQAVKALEDRLGQMELAKSRRDFGRADL